MADYISGISWPPPLSQALAGLYLNSGRDTDVWPVALGLFPLSVQQNCVQCLYKGGSHRLGKIWKTCVRDVDDKRHNGKIQVTEETQGQNSAPTQPFTFDK